MTTIARLALDLFSTEAPRLIAADGTPVVSRVIPMAKRSVTRKRAAAYVAMSEMSNGHVYIIKNQPLFDNPTDANIYADAYARQHGELRGHVTYVGAR